MSDNEPVPVDSGGAAARSPARGAAWAPYVAPMAAFILLTQVEPMAKSWYVWVYIAKVLVVCGVLWAGRSVLGEIRLDRRVLPVACLVGLAVLAEWILLDPFYPHILRRVAFNPFAAISSPAVLYLFLGFRFFGISIVVPIVEELFWRSFLLRWATDPDFNRLPVGTFTWGAFWLVTAAFGFSHPEWLSGILCGAAYALLLRQTRSLFACVVAHGVTNLGLAAYVVACHQWKFW